ncbi:MAG: Fe-S cluster assembly protein HesB [Propionibacteriales bacterium]|nr:Fe-S cluster assembly protein HesB [Propionibacteriales bacterium]
MLTLTENASTIIKTITGSGEESETSGLRISSETSDSPDLSVAAAGGPEPSDQVIEEGGARVFLEENAAVTLDDKVLDAQVDSSGAVQFTLIQQAS